MDAGHEKKQNNHQTHFGQSYHSYVISMEISGYHVCLVDEVNIKVNTRTLVASQGG